MFAGHYRLDRLTVLLDANNSQVDGPVDTITTIEPVAAKWRAFGWDVVELDGHDVDAVTAALAGGTEGTDGTERTDGTDGAGGVDGTDSTGGTSGTDAFGGAGTAAGHARPRILVCRTSTRHGLACLPPDADGHFIKLPADLAAAAERELTERLEQANA